MRMRAGMLACLLATAGLAPLAMAGDSPTLRVIATNVKSDAGAVHVWVYDKADDWLSDRYRTQKVVRVAGNRDGDAVTLELVLPPGEYALSIFHDVNDNGKLESNFIGLPKEPAGLSNNLRPRFGPPKFKDAKFALEAGATVEQSIKLQ